MSNIIEMRCSKDEIYIKAANGAEWAITRPQIQAIYQTKTGSAATRKSATITDVLASMESTLGANYASALFATLDFDPLDLNKDLIMSLS